MRSVSQAEEFDQEVAGASEDFRRRGMIRECLRLVFGIIDTHRETGSLEESGKGTGDLHCVVVGSTWGSREG